MKTLKNRRAVKYFEAKMEYSLGPAELEQMRTEHTNVDIIDVRDAEDFAKGHIPRAINLPMNEWDLFIGMSRERKTVFYCYSQQCHLATQACLLFARKGLPVMELEGGWKAWQEYGYDIETAGEEKARLKAA